MYWIRDLDGYSWPFGIVPHGLPENGVFVVREVCDPRLQANPGEHEVQARWHLSQGHRVLSWHSISGPEELSVIEPPALPIYAFGTLHYEANQKSPPIAFLRYLKNLAQDTRTTVSFYHYNSGAERAVCQEYAWVFGDEEAVYVWHDYHHIMRYSAMGEERLSEPTSVLMRVLNQYGLQLKTWYFAPHTRAFNWRKYDVSRPRGK